MAEGKWFHGLSADSPAADAARQVLAVRLAVVPKYLPLAAEKADEDVEYVHQLRVATRRSGAALRLFRSVLPRRRFREARDVLRTIRQAAGGARDCDVFLKLLDKSEALSDPQFAATLNFLIGYTLGQRTSAQELLQATAAAATADLARICRTLPDAPDAHDSAGPTTARLASEVIAVLFDDFRQTLAARPETADELHQMRITAKRVRYAVEVFADLYPAEVKDRIYPAIADLQEILGDVQDGHSASLRLTAIGTRLWLVRPGDAERIVSGLNAVGMEMKDQIVRGRKAFRKWRDGWQSLTDDCRIETLLQPPA